MITKETLKEWLQDEVTLSWFRGIRQKVSELNNTSVLDTASVDSTALGYARQQGIKEGLLDALDVNQDEVIEEE